MKELRFDYYTEHCPYEQYIEFVDETKFVRDDYGKWVNFRDSFPPVGNKPYNGTLIELFHNGEASFESIYVSEPQRNEDYKRVVRFMRYDENQWFWEKFFCGEELYWRFLPDPPGNEGYDVG